MASTYSSNLKIELIGTGEQTGTWGTTTNSNFSNVFEQSIVGRVTVNFATDANKTLSATDSVSSQDFRNVYLNLTSSGSLTATRDLIVPTINKNYIIQNNTTGSQSIRVITAAGTGITVPTGATCAVYVDGTNVIQAFDYLPVINIGTIDLTNLEVTNIKAKDGTASMTIADSTGVVTFSAAPKISTLTSGRVVYATTSGQLTDSANLLYSGTDLTVYGITVGRGAGAVATNTAVGAGVLSSGSQSGTNLAGFGAYALQSNTSGNYNSGFGFGALNANTTGSDNTASGYQSLLFNTTGSYNTAFGDNALRSNTTASENTAIGYQSGYSNTTGTAVAYFGFKAGYSTTGGLNTFIGHGAGNLVTSGAGNTVLGRYNGNQGGLDIRTASNYIVLSDGDGNPRAYWDNTGTFKMTQDLGGVGDLAQFKDTGSAYGSGAVYVRFTNNAGSTAGSIQHTASTTTNYNTSSDQRLKIDKGVATDTSVIDNIVIHDFEWKEDGRLDRGVFAQEAYEVKPSAVAVGNDKVSENGVLENPWGVDYSKFVPDLVVHAQQLKKMVQELKAEVDSLKQQLAAK